MQDKLKEYARKEHIFELKAELASLEEKLKTPERTVEDIVRHMQIIKELKNC